MGWGSGLKFADQVMAMYYYDKVVMLSGADICLL